MRADHVTIGVFQRSHLDTAGGALCQRPGPSPCWRPCAGLAAPARLSCTGPRRGATAPRARVGGHGSGLTSGSRAGWGQVAKVAKRHSRLATTADLYTHVLREVQRSGSDRIGDLLVEHGLGRPVVTGP